MNHYQKCPICEGRGIVPKGFYEKLGRLSKKESEPCRLCSATGAIYHFVLQFQPAVPEPFTIPLDPFPGTTWIGDPPGSCTSVSITTDPKEYIHQN